jgi:subtilisin-like proprotein convertase family protein
MATFAVSSVALAQSKDVLADVARLEQQAGQLMATHPALATKLKARAADLLQQLYSTQAPVTGGYNVVAPPYSITGVCGAFDSGTPGTTLTVASTATPIAIPDVSTITDSVVIGGLGTQTFDVDLLLNITHTYAGDLDITLTSPAGTIVDVTSDNGGANDDVFAGTLFDDESLNQVTTYIYTNGVAAPDLQPEVSFNATLRGENPNGTWTLSVTDDVGADIGTLNSWSLSVTDGVIVSIPPTFGGSPAVFSTGPVAIPLPDLTTTTIPLLVSGATSNIARVEVFVEITHTFNGDLQIDVQSPAGTIVNVSNRRGGANDDVFNGTLFRKDSPNPIASYVFTNLVVAPDLGTDGDMDGFAGENANGTWNLIFYDWYVAFDNGTLTSWKLCFDAPTATPYCTAKVNSLGCTPSISATGAASATATSGFTLSTVNVINNKPGLYLYTSSGQGLDGLPGRHPVRRRTGASLGAHELLRQPSAERLLGQLPDGLQHLRPRAARRHAPGVPDGRGQP